jgi:hypothetical protein
MASTERMMGSSTEKDVLEVEMTERGLCRSKTVKSILLFTSELSPSEESGNALSWNL